MAKKKENLLEPVEAAPIEAVVEAPIQEPVVEPEGEVFYAIRDPMKGMGFFITTEANYVRQMSAFDQRPPEIDSAKKSYQEWLKGIRIVAKSKEEALQKLGPQ